MKQRHFFIHKSVISDPAIICPAAGYVTAVDHILNPLLPVNGWILLATFQNNSPAGQTFDPTIVASSGEFAWDLGDGTILVGDKAISHSYLSTATRTVKLYGKGTCVITQVDFNSDNILGALDLSNAAFAALTSIELGANASMTSVMFPSTITGTIASLQIYSTGITGTLDLSKFTAFTSTATIYLHSNPSMTGITFASSITGTISALYIYSTGITGTLDLSKFTAFTTSAYIWLHTNASMTGVTFASSITGTIASLQIYSTGITGTLNLSKFTAFTTSTYIMLHTNASMTGVTFASSITGTIASLYIYSTGITGTLDLSKFTAFTSTATIYLYSNPSMTGITFASSITGTISALYIYSTGITGTLDLSKFTAFTSTASIYLYSNPSMTGVTFASSITGTISALQIYSTGITGTLDLSKFGSFTTSAIVNLNLNPAMTGVVFKPTTVTGIIKTLRLDENISLGYVDLTKLNTGVTLLGWRFDGNNWPAAIVNQVLADIDTISAAGFASRSINIGGSNVDPDASSGGFNGTAARSSLITKTFTVTIT